MAWVAEDLFNGYSDGDLNANNGGSGWSGAWSTNTLADVQGTVTYEGAKGILDAGGNPAASRILTTAISDSSSIMYIAMRRSSTSTGQHYIILQAGASSRVSIIFNNAGNILGNGTTIRTYAANTWYVLRITLNTSGNSYTVATSTDAYGTAGTFSSESSTITMGTSGNIDRVVFDADTGANSYWDYISGTSPFTSATNTGNFFVFM